MDENKELWAMHMLLSFIHIEMSRKVLEESALYLGLRFILSQVRMNHSWMRNRLSLSAIREK